MVKAGTRKRVAAKADLENPEHLEKPQVNDKPNGTSVHKKQRVEEPSSAPEHREFVPTKQLEINQDPDRVLFA